MEIPVDSYSLNIETEHCTNKCFITPKIRKGDALYVIEITNTQGDKHIQTMLWDKERQVLYFDLGSNNVPVDFIELEEKLSDAIFNHNL
jgi:hypothetical protein